MSTQPKALQLADAFDNAMVYLHQISIGHSMTIELRRQHARIAELEAERAAIIAEKNEYKYALRYAQNELEAQHRIGAGGVKPLRKPASVGASERELFEAVASDSGKWPKAIERDAKGNYLLLTTANGWMWWREARAAMAAQAKQGGV